MTEYICAICGMKLKIIYGKLFCLNHGFRDIDEESEEENPDYIK